MIDVTSLEIKSDASGNGTVQAWCKCTTADDIDDVVLWLGLARDVMVQWQDIRSRRRAATAANDTGNVTSIKGKDK